jgi:dCTP deaminase
VAAAMLGTDDLRTEIAKGNSGDKAYLSVLPVPTEIKGASVDLHLGRWFSQPHQSRSTFYDFREDVANSSAYTAKEYFAPFHGEFVLHPGRFILAITLEWIRLPANRAAYVTGKSNTGRRGLVIETAPGVHPHFNGCLTLEMTNLGEIPLKIRPGMKICQLFVHETGECPEEDGGQFSAQIKPTFGRNF